MNAVVAKALKLYVEGKGAVEIARAVGLSESRVRWIILEAKGREFDRLVKDGTASPLTAPNSDGGDGEPATMNELIRLAAGRGSMSAGESEGAADGEP